MRLAPFLVAGGLLVASPARGDDAERYTLATAIAAGADHGPGVAVAAAPAASYEDALAASHGLFVHPPRLSGYVGARDHERQVGLEASVTAVQDLALRSVAGPREDAARALLDETHADVERARRDAAAHAANAWIAVREAEEVLVLRRNVTTQASDLAAAAHKRVNAGTSLPSDAAIAEGDLALAQAAELDGEGVVTETLAELRHALALPADADADAVGALVAPPVPPVVGPTTARDGLATSPVVAAAAARARRSASDARLARALAEPTLAVGASFTHEGTGDDIWTAVVQVPIPLSRSGKYDESRQLGDAAAAARDVTVVRAEIQRQIALALHECEHTRETRDAYARALPPLGEAVRMARAQLDAGSVTATVVSIARQRLLEAEERATHATADVLRADVELARVTGTILRRDFGADR